MRSLGVEVPDNRLEQRVEELTEMRNRINAEIRATKAAMRKQGKRGPRPPCGTEKGYQRHYREGETCIPCMNAHRAHSRRQYAAAKESREAS